MTREEAITVFKAFMDNPLFSDVHKAAFNIAIHDIKQRHDWDINNLILINKENDNSVLEQIKAEIEKDSLSDVSGSKFIFVRRVNEIIDNHISGKENE